MAKKVAYRPTVQPNFNDVMVGSNIASKLATQGLEGLSGVANYFRDNNIAQHEQTVKDANAGAEAALQGIDPSLNGIDRQLAIEDIMANTSPNADKTALNESVFKANQNFRSNRLNDQQYASGVFDAANREGKLQREIGKYNTAQDTASLQNEFYATRNNGQQKGIDLAHAFKQHQINNQGSITRGRNIISDEKDEVNANLNYFADYIPKEGENAGKLNIREAQANWKGSAGAFNQMVENFKDRHNLPTSAKTVKALKEGSIPKAPKINKPAHTGNDQFWGFDDYGKPETAKANAIATNLGNKFVSNGGSQNVANFIDNMSTDTNGQFHQDTYEQLVKKVNEQRAGGMDEYGQIEYLRTLQ